MTDARKEAMPDQIEKIREEYKKIDPVQSPLGVFLPHYNRWLEQQLAAAREKKKCAIQDCPFDAHYGYCIEHSEQSVYLESQLQTAQQTAREMARLALRDSRSHDTHCSFFETGDFDKCNCPLRGAVLLTQHKEEKSK